LNELASRQRYLACEIDGQRYNIGVKYGLLNAQLALGLAGVDRDRILTQLVDLLSVQR
jgi:UTP--glucose-1-phosphate uridylyltransferase